MLTHWTLPKSYGAGTLMPILRMGKLNKRWNNLSEVTQLVSGKSPDANCSRQNHGPHPCPNSQHPWMCWLINTWPEALCRSDYIKDLETGRSSCIIWMDPMWAQRLYKGKWGGEARELKKGEATMEQEPECYDPTGSGDGRGSWTKECRQPRGAGKCKEINCLHKPLEEKTALLTS